MHFLKLVLRNALRHKLRTGLTVTGLVVATLAFGLLQTVIHAWYAGADVASSTRLVTRNSISLVFPLPLAYLNKIRAIDGVTGVTYSSWFGGIYQDRKNFFPQFAVDVNSFFNLYPEISLPEDQKIAFLRDRRGTVIGTQLAQTYGFKIGDVIPLQGGVYPGTWEFVVRGIFKYRGANVTADLSNMYFHWDYLNEVMKKTTPRRADQVGVFITEVKRPDLVAPVAAAIDQEFRNSLAETLTESEKAFNLGFVSMSEQIITVIRIVSFVVIFIIFAVMANTMAMSARERLAEYATFKALGFGPGFVAALIFGESLLIALCGGGLGILLTWPTAAAFGQLVSRLFPIFRIQPETYLWQLGCAALVGLGAAVAPGLRAGSVNIVEGLRRIG
jgi:putative ABC transport system permease protein